MPIAASSVGSRARRGAWRTLIVVVVAPWLVLASRPAAADRGTRPDVWSFDVGLGYGESWAADGGPTAYAPFFRMRGARRLTRGLLLSVDVTGPVVPVPWGQVSAGLGLGYRVRLGEPQALDGGLEAETQLITAAGAGYAYTVSGLSEGYIRISDQATSFYGPYGRGEIGLMWVVRPDPARTRLGAVSVGAVVGASALRATYRVPERAAGWRLSVEGLLVADLRW